MAFGHQNIIQQSNVSPMKKPKSLEKFFDEILSCVHPLPQVPIIMTLGFSFCKKRLSTTVGAAQLRR
jgi:hypothetical protein